jgi:hypothetical protein
LPFFKAEITKISTKINLKIKPNKKMKTTIKLIILAFVLFLNSCKKDEDATPALQCKLSVIDRGNGNKHIYAYDASGKITTMTREFDGDGSGKISKYVYTLNYDATGLLTNSTVTLDGVPDLKENYAYTNGKISKTTFEYADGTKGYNAIKYNSSGQILEFSYQSAEEPDFDSKQYFEYAANGNITKRGYSDMTGTTKFFEAVTKPVGTAKSAEILVTEHGLPFDLLTGFSYQKASGNVGTVTEIFFLDDKGVLVSGGSEKITAVKTNAKGYITEISSEDDTKVIYTSKFELLDCN